MMKNPNIHLLFTFFISKLNNSFFVLKKNTNAKRISRSMVKPKDEAMVKPSVTFYEYLPSMGFRCKAQGEC